MRGPGAFLLGPKSGTKGLLWQGNEGVTRVSAAVTTKHEPRIEQPIACDINQNHAILNFFGVFMRFLVLRFCTNCPKFHQG